MVVVIRATALSTRLPASSLDGNPPLIPYIQLMKGSWILSTLFKVRKTPRSRAGCRFLIPLLEGICLCGWVYVVY
jgi:hypothetical protein